MRTEEHEFKEWFKHDGVNMFDPHPHPNKVLLGNVLSDRPAITLLQFLDKMTYKKGWEFKVRGPSESAMYGLSGLSNLLILHEVKDATGKIESSYPVVVQQSFKIPETVDWPVQGWASFMKECIMALETHEFKEWFKLDGHCIYDPHPEMRPMMIDSALLKSATLDVTNEIFKSATFMNRFAIDQKKGLSIGMLNIA